MLYFVHFMDWKNDFTCRRIYSIAYWKKTCQNTKFYITIIITQKSADLSADFHDAGKGTWTLMTAIVTRTWTVRVCQFRHSCISICFAASQLTKHIIQQRHLNVNTFFVFFEIYVFYIFFTKLLTLCPPFGIILSCRKQINTTHAEVSELADEQD